MNVDPVTFPPGRARLWPTPTPTASPTPAKTIGMVVVAFFDAKAAGVLQEAKRTSTRCLTRSAVSPDNLSYRPSAPRYANATLRPAPNPRRTGDPPPTRRILPAGCASAASGAARRLPATVPRNARRFITRLPGPPAAGAAGGAAGHAG